MMKLGWQSVNFSRTLKIEYSLAFCYVATRKTRMKEQIYTTVVASELPY
jgi:hypothetical protein